MRIKLLADVLINQIAAGEVIERPVSIVKELVENSLDADATSVSVDAVDGGIQYLRVLDNGNGIGRDDLGLALRRHATSKISSLSDLETIATYGFRGEALSSIAAVSHLTLKSRARGAEKGWEIVVDNSCQASGSLSLSAVEDGTIVEVRNLFHHVPARKKFLRSPRTEFLHVYGLMKRLALCRPHIRLRLSHNGRQVMHYRPAVNWQERATQVYGQSFSACAKPFAASSELFRVEGWLLPPTTGQARSTEQLTFLNGRSIRDRHLSHAMRRAYETTGDAVCIPGFVIFLAMDPRLFDINVHPTKSEVRFRDTRSVHDFVYSSVYRSLRDAVPPIDARFTNIDTSEIADAAVEYLAPQPGKVYPTAYAEIIAAPDPHNPSTNATDRRATPSERSATRSSAGFVNSGHQPQQSIVVLHQRYVVYESAAEVWWVADLLGGIAELLLRSIDAARSHALLTSIPLLLPSTVRVADPHGVQLEALAHASKSFGLSLRIDGSEMTIVRVPEILRGADEKRAVADLLDGRTDDVSHSQLLRQMAETLARHGLRARAAHGGREWFVTCAREVWEMYAGGASENIRRLTPEVLSAWLGRATGTVVASGECGGRSACSPLDLL